MKTGLKKFLPTAISLLIVIGFGLAVMYPHANDRRDEKLASRFAFDAPVGLRRDSGVKPAEVRKVHPSLARISGWISSVGASAALGDLDADGLANDLCDVDPGTDQVTIRHIGKSVNTDTSFTLAPQNLRHDPATMAPMGCMFGDINEDGWLDVIVYYWGRTPIAFLQRNGEAPLTRQSFRETELVPGNERWFTNAATMADFDGDGHIDLLFANYFPDGSDTLNANGRGTEILHDTKSKSFNGGSKHFLLYQGATAGLEPTVRFQHVSALNNPELDRGWTLALAAGDLDGDGLNDLYLANDFGPDRLLHNRSTPGKLAFDVIEGQRGFFTPKSAVLGQDSFKGMGAEIGDLNSDGLPDILVSNITSRYALNESHMIWLNTDERSAWQRKLAPFVQKSEQLGLSRSGWGWDIKLADLNNDGLPEVIQATGFMKGKVNRWPELQALATGNDQIMSNPGFWPRFKPGDDLSGHESNPIFTRDASGRYHDIAPELGLGETWVTRGIAIADVDGDGLLDLVYANQWEASVFIHNRCKNCGQSLSLRLLLQKGKSGASLRDEPGQLRLPAAIGARVTLLSDKGKPRTAQVDGGNGHSGRRSSEIHFGLGKRSATDAPIQARIDWRAFDGTLRSATVTLQPGRHTLLLGS